MISPKHITKLTAVGLVVGAFAAPAASAMPFGGIPTQASLHRAPVGWLLDPSAFGSSYSRQDKQLVPSSPTQTPVTARPTVVRVSNPISRFGPPRAFGFRGPDNLGEAALGAGAVVFVILGIGGAPALLHRPTRKRAGVRTGKPAVATG